jgi:uncharacterized protein (DUF2252 family)
MPRKGKGVQFARTLALHGSDRYRQACEEVLFARFSRDNAQRVVRGARNLAPFLGERMLAMRILGTSVVIRELLPQDLKLEMEAIGAG